MSCPDPTPGTVSIPTRMGGSCPDATPDQPEMVDHPAHYNQVPGVECIDVIEALGLGFNTGSAMKYIWRHPDKGKELEDLKKARWYLDREIARLETS